MLRTLLTWLACCLLGAMASQTARGEEPRFSWTELPSLPNELGVAGPFAGLHGDALIVAGGANFPKPVWENEKVWHDDIYVLAKSNGTLRWHDGGRLPRPTGYGAAVSTKHGVLCMGGNDAGQIFGHTYLLKWNSEQHRVERLKLPAMPRPCAYGAAAILGDVVCVAGGQSGLGLDSAMNQLWLLDLSPLHDNDGGIAKLRWQVVSDCPWSTRAFNLTVTQERAGEQRLYVIGGRRQTGDRVEFLKDAWEFTLSTRTWRRCADASWNVAAGIGAASSPGQIAVLGGATGELFLRSDELRDKHPGFPKKSLVYDVNKDVWTEGGATPANHVTTIAVRWGEDIIVPSGEVRPRVRSPKVFRVDTNP